MPRASGRRTLKKTIGLLFGVCILLLAFVVTRLFVLHLENDPSTDDASIDADVVHIAPSVSGYIVDLPVSENQLVAKGDLLFQIDPQPFQYRVDLVAAQLAESEALLETKRRSVGTQKSTATVSSDQVSQARDSLRLASNTLNRLEPLAPKGYVSRQQVDDARTAQSKASIALTQAQEQARASAAAVDKADAAMAAVAANRNALALAKRDLAMTTVRATHAGRVTGLTIKTGEYANLSQAIFTLVVTEEWFASGNFRETDLAHIQVGTCATGWSLIDRARPIAGRVESVGFGVTDGDKVNVPRSVPYVEKSVNWVRVEQRFPVRVKLEHPPADLMRLGASAYIRIHGGQRC